MPLFNMARNGFNPHTWKFMNRYMVKCFCTDSEMENEGVPDFFLWLFRSLFGYRGPRPLFENNLQLIDFFLDGTFENMITHELAHNPDLCGGSKIIQEKIEKMREVRRKAAATAEVRKSPVPKKSNGKSKASSVVDIVETPEDQISTAELRLMKKLMKKFQSLDDDETGNENGNENENDSPILRRKSGKLKRRRSKGGGED